MIQSSEGPASPPHQLPNHRRSERGGVGKALEPRIVFSLKEKCGRKEQPPSTVPYVGVAAAMLMLVPRQQSERSARRSPFSFYASVFACRRFALTMPPRLDAEQQGNPKTTRFFMLPFLFCDVFRPPSLPPPVIFQPSGFRDEPFDRISWTLQA